MIHDPTEKAPIREYALLLLLAALWGGAFTLIKVALESFEPMTIVSARVMIGGAILVAFAAVRGDAFPKTRKRWGELAIQGGDHSLTELVHMGLYVALACHWIAS